MTVPADDRERRRLRLIAIGEALHGPRWQAPLARDLNITQPFLSQIVVGRRPVSANLERALVTLCDLEYLRLLDLQSKVGKWALELQTELDERSASRGE